MRTFESCLLLLFVDMQLIAAGRKSTLNCTRECILVRERVREHRFQCLQCLEDVAVSVEFLMLWCLQCPVCKANQVSPHSRNDNTLISARTWISREKSQTVRQASTSTTVIATIASYHPRVKRVTNSSKNTYAGGSFPNPDQSTLPSWTIVVSVVSPILALVTVVLVWFIRKSMKANDQQASVNHSEEMVPLTEDQLDDETNRASLQNTPAANHRNQAPRFTETLQSGHAMIGKSVTLRCKVEGAQPLDIKWKKDGKELGLTHNHTVDIKETKLTISSMTPELGGQYMCIATNRYGQAITRSTIAVRGFFDEVDSIKDIPSVKETINSRLEISNPQDTAIASAGASVYFNDDIQWRLSNKYPGGNVRIGPTVDEDESIRDYRERMALHTSQYDDSYLKTYQEEKRMAFARQMEEFGYTATTISWLSGKETSDEESSSIVEYK